MFLQKTLSVNEKDLCKYFEPGNHVKIVSGVHEGTTGMVLKVEGHFLVILSDTTKEDVSFLMCTLNSFDQMLVLMCYVQTNFARTDPCFC